MLSGRRAPAGRGHGRHGAAARTCPARPARSCEAGSPDRRNPSRGAPARPGRPRRLLAERTHRVVQPPSGGPVHLARDSGSAGIWHPLPLVAVGMVRAAGPLRPLGAGPALPLGTLGLPPCWPAGPLGNQPLCPLSADRDRAAAGAGTLGAAFAVHVRPTHDAGTPCAATARSCRAGLQRR
jgi:hypothetical protein